MKFDEAFKEAKARNLFARPKGSELKHDDLEDYFFEMILQLHDCPTLDFAHAIAERLQREILATDWEVVE
jgi:hypothetical protein